MQVSLKARAYRALQNLAIAAARPYVRREYPGWGRVYAAIVGGYERNWLWAGAPVKTIRGKRHGYLMRLDLSRWADRSAFFLGRWYDLSTQLLISDLLRSGDCVIDVGANRGMFALAASRLVGDTGQVICCEPNPDCFNILEREIWANSISNITVMKVGLGSHDEELVLSVPVINSGEGTFGRSAYDTDTTYQVRAWVRKGDEIIGDLRPALIKLDVEGFECNALEGLAGTISRSHPIILTEVVSAHLERCGASVARLRALMESYGYRGYTICLRKTKGVHAWQLAPFDEQDPVFDALWLRPEHLQSHAESLKDHLPPR